jgi:hypothetical protein
MAMAMPEAVRAAAAHALSEARRRGRASADLLVLAGAAGPGGCFRVFLRVRAGSLIELKAQVAAALLAEGAAARAIEAVRPRAGPRAAPSAGAGAWLLPVRFHATAQPGPGR